MKLRVDLNQYSYVQVCYDCYFINDKKYEKEKDCQFWDIRKVKKNEFCYKGIVYFFYVCYMVIQLRRFYYFCKEKRGEYKRFLLIVEKNFELMLTKIDL